MGVIMADVALPPSASMERTEAIAMQVQEMAEKIPEIDNILKVVGRGMISGAGSNYAMVIMKLKPWDQRKGKGQDVKSIIGKMFGSVSTIREAKIIFFAPPVISGFGISGGFSFELQDKSGKDIAIFSKVGNDFLAALNQRPEIQYASYLLQSEFPAISD